MSHYKLYESLRDGGNLIWPRSERAREVLLFCFSFVVEVIRGGSRECQIVNYRRFSRVCFLNGGARAIRFSFFITKRLSVRNFLGLHSS